MKNLSVQQMEQINGGDCGTASLYFVGAGLSIAAGGPVGVLLGGVWLGFAIAQCA